MGRLPKGTAKLLSTDLLAESRSFWPSRKPAIITVAVVAGLGIAAWLLERQWQRNLNNMTAGSRKMEEERHKRQADFAPYLYLHGGLLTPEAFERNWPLVADNREEAAKLVLELRARYGPPTLSDAFLLPPTIGGKPYHDQP